MLAPEERAAARMLVWRNRHDAAVQALFNLLERSTFHLQGSGIVAGATAHDQGQACGALHTYTLARTWLEVEPVKEETA